MCWETSGSGVHLDATWRAPPTRTLLKVQIKPHCAQRHSSDRDKELYVSSCPPHFSDPSWHPRTNQIHRRAATRSTGLKGSAAVVPDATGQTQRCLCPRQVRAKSDPWWGLYWSDFLSSTARGRSVRLGSGEFGGQVGTLNSFVFFFWSCAWVCSGVSIGGVECRWCECQNPKVSPPRLSMWLTSPRVLVDRCIIWGFICKKTNTKPVFYVFFLIVFICAIKRKSLQTDLSLFTVLILCDQKFNNDIVMT